MHLTWVFSFDFDNWAVCDIHSRSTILMPLERVFNNGALWLK